MKRHQPERHQPLKALVFEILLILADGERHGYALAKELERRASAPTVLPANLYRTLRDMMARGWIAETEERPDPAYDDRRRRYYHVTDSGLEIARRESERLSHLVREARDKRLLGHLVS